MKSKMIIDAWQGKQTEYTPIWLMRQAGRYLPEYREVRAQAGSFLDLCYNPALAAEVTLQPLRRFDLDAAIIFSDILVIPHAMGQGVSFVEGEGPKLEPMDFSKLHALDSRLDAVYAALDATRKDLPEGKALIGFAGGPFTIASYMIEGGGGHDFSKTRAMMRDDKPAFTTLIDLVTQAVTQHLKNQIAHGVDAVQIFESHAGQLVGAEFAEFVVRPARAITAGLDTDIPVIGFARGAAEDDFLRYAVDSGTTVIGLDQMMNMRWASKNLPPRLGMQGNLAPEALLAGGEAMKAEALGILESAGKRPFVFNLGHGVIKETNPDHVAQLVDIVHGYRS